MVGAEGRGRWANRMPMIGSDQLGEATGGLEEKLRLSVTHCGRAAVPSRRGAVVRRRSSGHQGVTAAWRRRHPGEVWWSGCTTSSSPGD